MNDDIAIEIVRLSSAVAELRLRSTIPNVELRGQMTGPHHATISTLEIAYPLKKFDSGGRIIIPEPNLWTADAPFTYRGRIEVWRDDQLIGERNIEIGLKVA